MNLLCDGRVCAYRRHADCEQGESVCAYSLITGKLRGCPAGRECIHRTDKLPKGFTQVERSNRHFNGSIA